MQELIKNYRVISTLFDNLHLRQSFKCNILINILQSFMLQHSKTTESLITSLSKLKESKKEITQKLRVSIERNNQIYEQHQESSRRFSQRLINSRERSIQVLEKKLNHKLKSDELNDLKLELIQQETVRKRQEIGKKLEEIGNRNSQRIKELEIVEQQLIRKVQQDIEKNQTRERKLRSLYERIQKQERKVSETKAYQKKESLEQWRLLQAEKWRIESIARQLEERQNKLVQQKNPIPTKKDEKKKQEERYIPTEKQYNKLKNPAIINSKEMGNQYLEQAKLMHRQHAVKKKQKKLMNINLKVVNYGSEIMQKIFRNTSDLSNFNNIREQKPVENIELVPSSKLKEQSTIVPITIQPKFQFKLTQDLETQRHLKLIKDNLEKLAKTDSILQKQSQNETILRQQIEQKQG